MARGKRYTEEERQKVIDFALAYNKKNGRGGKAAAAKKFGVNINSVLNWMSRAKQPQAARSVKAVSTTPKQPSPVKSTSGKENNAVGMLERMLEIQKQIDALNSEYAAIKSKL